MPFRLLQLLPAEQNSQSTLQIESDLILSAVLTGLSAQLATAVTVITKVPILIPGDKWSIHPGMSGFGLEYKNSLSATRNVWALRLGRTWANARICLVAIVASTIPKKLAAIVRSRFKKLIAIVAGHQEWRSEKSPRRGTCWNGSPLLRQVWIA